MTVDPLLGFSEIQHRDWRFYATMEAIGRTHIRVRGMSLSHFLQF